ncbi:MAG: hypothetical protein WAU86_23050 [Oricola sp.]
MSDKLAQVRGEFESELEASQRAATMMSVLVAEQSSARRGGLTSRGEV